MNTIITISATTIGDGFVQRVYLNVPEAVALNRFITRYGSTAAFDLQTVQFFDELQMTNGQLTMVGPGYVGGGPF